MIGSRYQSHLLVALKKVPVEGGREGEWNMAKPVFSTRVSGNIRVVGFEIPGGVTTPQESKESVAEIEEGLSGNTPVVFDGRGPVWLFAMLVHSAHATPWVAVRDPRLGAVVVASHSPAQKTGDVIPFPE